MGDENLILGGETPENTADVEQHEAPETTETETEGGEEGEEKPAAPAFQPNLKYRVLDQEKEFDKRLSPVVKDAETEKYLRELYEKADGLDVVKPKLHAERQAHQQTRQKLVQRDNFFQECLEYRNSGDLGALLERWQIPESAVAEYLLRKAKAQQDPEARAMYEGQEQARRENLRLVRENRNLTSQHSDAIVQQRTIELHSVLNQPEVATVAEQVDRTAGKTGTFFQLVKQHALAVHAETGQDLTPDEAVKQVCERMGKFVSTTPAGTTAQPSAGGAGSSARPAQPARAAAPAPRPATLPKTTPASVSPAKKQIRSIEDLKKRAAELASGG